MTRSLIAAMLLVVSSRAFGQSANCEPLEPCTPKEKVLFERFRANASASIYPERWRLIQLQDEILVAFDTKSVERLDTNVFRVWLRTEKSEWRERWHDADGNHEKTANALMMQQGFNCANRQAQGVTMSVYFNRTVLWGPVDLNEGWHSISPDSAEEYWYPQICKILTGSLPR